jgi:hypothetical protein
LENKTLYQFCEYGPEDTLPADNGSSILATTDATLRARWISIDNYSVKSFIGSFTTEDWTLSNDGETYTYTIQFPNALNSTSIELRDSNGVLVYPEKIQYTSTSSGLTGVTLTIAAIPDCKFNGNYSIFFDNAF